MKNINQYRADKSYPIEFKDAHGYSYDYFPYKDRIDIYIGNMVYGDDIGCWILGDEYVVDIFHYNDLFSYDLYTKIDIKYGIIHENSYFL